MDFVMWLLFADSRLIEWASLLEITSLLREAQSLHMESTTIRSRDTDFFLGISELEHGSAPSILQVNACNI